MEKKFILGFFVIFLSFVLLSGTQTKNWNSWVFKLNCATRVACGKEMKTFDLLKQLIGRYNVTPWVRTRTIHIQDGVFSRSNPLTINTEKNGDPLCLLSVFLHEQIHLLQSANQAAFSRAMDDIEKMFPTLPPSLSTDPKKTYRHFIVIFFEIEAMEILVGPGQAKAVSDRKPLYRWVRDRIYENRDLIRRIYRRHGLGFNV